MNDIKDIDVNALPVHLFVKSQKEAKKLKKSTAEYVFRPVPFRRGKRFEV
jgi:hypothetical protein